MFKLFHLFKTGFVNKCALVQYTPNDWDYEFSRGYKNIDCFNCRLYLS